MRIVIERSDELAQAVAHVVDPDNFTQLSVESRSVSLEDARPALVLAGLGHLSDDHAWLAIDSLRAKGRTGTASWDESFDAMIRYAGAQGWVDETTGTVRAHCVWTA
jgi:hypothetical protein